MDHNLPWVDISVIILSKDEERYIGSTLDMIFKQDIDKKYEVIILDSDSCDSTLRIARAYPVKIHKISKEEFGHGKARNQAVQVASGEIIVFLNGDALPTNKNWLKALIANFKNDHRIAGVYSRIYPRLNCNPLRSWEILDDTAYLYNKMKIKYIENFNLYLQMSPRQKRRLLAFQTISCAIRKDFLLQYPFKDIEFGEDLEWSKRVMERGFKIVFEPESSVSHSHDFYYSFTKTFKKYFDDAKLNNDLLNIYSWGDFPLLAGQIVYKIFRDINYILRLNKNSFYKIVWLFYSPVVRLAEFWGTIFGSHSQYLPYKLRSFFSLVCEIKRR